MNKVPNTFIMLITDCTRCQMNKVLLINKMPKHLPIVITDCKKKKKAKRKKKTVLMDKMPKKSSDPCHRL